MKRNLLLATDPPAPGPGTGAPTPPPSPTPPPAPSPSPAPSPDPGGNPDPFASIDSKIRKPTPPPAPPSGTPPATPAGAQPSAPSEPKTPKELRDYANRTKEDLTKANARLAKYESELQAFEGTKKEKDALMAKATAAEDRIKSLEQELGVLRFQASPEFKTNYEERFNAMAEDARAEIDSLQVGQWVTDEATNAREWKPIGPASFDKHFSALYNMARPDARMRAKELFGPEDAELVMTWYTQLHNMNREKNTRLASEKKNWEDNQKKQLAENATRQSNYQNAVERVRKDLETKFPEFYQAPPDDTEAADMLKEGWKLVEMKPATFDQAVILNSRNRMNAASAPMLQHLLVKAREEIATLKSQLESKSTRPGEGGKRQAVPSGSGPEKSWEEEAKEVLAAAGR